MTNIAVTHKFPTGGMWEDYQFEIRENVEIIIHGDGNICPHCHSEHHVECKGFNDHIWCNRVCTCPRVVVAWNEGGCNTTGVCLDCILDAAESLTSL